MSLSYLTGQTSLGPIRAAGLSAQTAAFPNNPLANVFIQAIPGSDGQEVFVSVAGVGAGSSAVTLNVDPGLGGGSHKGSYAMTLSGTSFIATAIGFAPGQDTGSDGDDTMSLTTTLGSQVVGSGAVNFQRAFVETGQPETISVDNGDFVLEFLNTGSFQADTYVLVMSTHTPPGALPFGYQLAGKSYNIRPSGSLTRSEKLMTLNLKYSQPLPGGSDPHTLTILRWDSLGQSWLDVGGNLLADSKLVSLASKEFGIYALASGPRWRDSFAEVSLSGVATLTNTQRGPGQTIILANATTGAVTSIPLSAAPGSLWGTLSFSASVPASTGLTVDILAADNSLLLGNVSSGTNLGLDQAGQPSLKLRANLSATTLGLTPQLHHWSLDWIVAVRKVHLPLVLK
jgi:hypothetical protein